MKPKNAESKKRLVLLDSHAILHRAYHALPDFASGGEPTGALYGLSLMLFKIIAELKPDYIVAAYDLPQPTYRHEAYEGYKAGRKETPAELASQIERSREIFRVFGIPIYDKEGFEADDILGTISELAKKDKKVEVIIASGDMDTLQLVDKDQVRVYTLKKGIKDTILYDEKAVCERFGFSPGLLPDYKGLRGDPSDNIPGIKGIGEKIATELIINFGGLDSLYKKLKKDADGFKKAGIKPRIINLLLESEEEAFFSRELGEIKKDVPIEFRIPKKSWKENLDPEKVLTLFGELGFRSLSEKIREMFLMKKVQTETASPEEAEKTAIALWLLDSDTTNPELSDILNFAGTDNFKKAREHIFSELEKTGLQKLFREVELPLISVIKKMQETGVKIDMVFLRELSRKYHQDLQKLEKTIRELSGRKFNLNSPKQLSEVLFDEMKLSAPNLKKTSGGARSTRESELLKLRETHPIIEKILEYRELQKLLSTYIDNIPEMVAKGGRLHADFNQAGTTTGRMSSQNPNLQNIPARSALGKEIRKAFVSEKGFKIVAFDYSQIELRIAAILSGDKKLIDIFKKGHDIHNSVAEEVFGVGSGEVTTKMRSHAKTINFGILYGMGVNSLKTALGTDRKTAQEFYNGYFEKFGGLALYLEKTKREAMKKGYTETFFGRRRYFPGLRSKLPFIRAQAERMAVNAPIQGTQADIIRIAMVLIDKNLSSKDVRLLLQVHDELVYEIREGKVRAVSREIKKTMENVISPDKINGINLAVDVSEGLNWGEMKKLKI
ncbi:hypothetical protein COV42_02075 [Candidatus Campbellbacteria bacterium CG11_big_fil_rev_8_21_14_0_20_44_21]|uniref:DNA-directed DNA polymerase n=1 Tax=Candidatus Campbellbacteria bacterium CG22_combo_CG10-13_8_21_14_all_43_18 TaxID=1974530 RepID=A0A2H0DW39_9BACT|nr:MAG: hypothetical protein COW82_02610 [Candidatus Campbellbacteria bacterium CG22_combo_CG10-13_8_21_14_all_43_18]PIR24214.1 MAG: hypothetical protein COV42_02075 [Candidatus Campbellbacteria bacterium CG11_big_fil_rev_8_21_14_0_20_44_21]